jgi:hypothetical protein
MREKVGSAGLFAAGSGRPDRQISGRRRAGRFAQGSSTTACSAMKAPAPRPRSAPMSTWPASSASIRPPGPEVLRRPPVRHRHHHRRHDHGPAEDRHRRLRPDLDRRDGKGRQRYPRGSAQPLPVMIRLFTAVAVPAEIGQGLLSRQHGIEGARWRPLEAFHITLKFIGDVQEPVAAELDEALAQIEARPSIWSWPASAISARAWRSTRSGPGSARTATCANWPRPMSGPPARWGSSPRPALHAPRHPGLSEAPRRSRGRRLGPGQQPAAFAAVPGRKLRPLFQLAHQRGLGLSAGAGISAGLSAGMGSVTISRKTPAITAPLS